MLIVPPHRPASRSHRRPRPADRPHGGAARARRAAPRPAPPTAAPWRRHLRTLAVAVLGLTSRRVAAGLVAPLPWPGAADGPPAPSPDIGRAAGAWLHAMGCGEDPDVFNNCLRDDASKRSRLPPHTRVLPWVAAEPLEAALGRLARVRTDAPVAISVDNRYLVVMPADRLCTGPTVALNRTAVVARWQAAGSGLPWGEAPFTAARSYACIQHLHGLSGLNPLGLAARDLGCAADARDFCRQYRDRGRLDAGRGDLSPERWRQAAWEQLAVFALRPSSRRGAELAACLAPGEAREALR